MERTVPGKFLILALFASWIGFDICLNCGPSAEAQVSNPLTNQPVSDGQDKPTSSTVTDFPAHLRTEAPSTLADLKLLEERVQLILEQVKPATVSVSGGSGVVVSADGLVLTAAHVNQQAGRTVRLTFPDGRRVRGTTLGNNTDADAGMIQIDTPGEYPFVELSEARPERGTWCLAVGYPVSFSSGQAPPVRLGRVRSTNRSLVRTDCTIMGGDSGGPLVDLDGKLIGIHSKVRNDLDDNLHVAISSFTSDWDRLLASEDWGRNAVPQSGYLGVQKVDGVNRALVGIVMEGSAAQQAGIKPGDEIIKLNEQEISSFQQLADLIRETKVREQVDITIVRNGRVIVYENVRLGRR